MAGHSKWANIKHRKDRADKKKGKIFSRCAKEIISAVKMGGADSKSNARLRLALQKARAANVPQDVVDRNIKKASHADQADYQEMTYELYGHGGVGILVEIMTDNKNRIASDMRIATNKRGGSIAQPGAVSFNFDRKGVIHIAKGKTEEELLDLLSSAGADDFEEAEDSVIVFTHPHELYNVKEALEQAALTVEDANLEMLPKTHVECDSENAQANIALIEWLENLDDVDEVYHNMKLS